MATPSAAARRALLIAVILLVVVSILLPADWIGDLRHRWWWFTYPLDRIENAQSAINLVHAILFLLLGAAMRLALPRWRLGRVALAMLMLGVATEMVQILVPGRHPRLSDAAVDFVAGVAGWAVMWGMGALCWRHRS